MKSRVDFCVDCVKKIALIFELINMKSCDNF